MTAPAPAVEPLGVPTPVASRLGRTFIRAAEFWRPGADGSLLEYGGGLHAPGSRMARISREMCFGRGGGLPGRAWETGAPVVLHQFEGSYFRRTDAARADGLSCAIALPIFLGDYLSSVVVFFCGDDDDSAGAIEVWQNDPRQSKDLSLSDGHYGRTDDTFEFIARRTSFRPGVGLPGQAWQQGLPVFLPDLGRAAAFLRADRAIRGGINPGLALPCLGQRHRVADVRACAGEVLDQGLVQRRDGAPRRVAGERTLAMCGLDGCLQLEVAGLAKA